VADYRIWPYTRAPSVLVDAGTASDGRLLGTFAIYSREPRSPTHSSKISSNRSPILRASRSSGSGRGGAPGPFWFLESMDQVNRASRNQRLEQMMSDVLDAVLAILIATERGCLSCDPEATCGQWPMEHVRPEFPGASRWDLICRDPGHRESVPNSQSFQQSCAIRPASNIRCRQRQRSFSARVYNCHGGLSQSGQALHVRVHQCSYPRIWTSQEERLFQEIGRRLEDALTSLLMFATWAKASAS